jgi:excisionase family DNA binding protein
MNEKRIEPYQVYTTPKAAELLGVSEMLIINACKSGKIKAKMAGKGWKILGENLLIFLESPSAIVASGVSTNMTNAETDIKKFK